MSSFANTNTSYVPITILNSLPINQTTHTTHKSMIGLLVENGPITLPTFPSGIPPGKNPSSSMGALFTSNPFAWTRKSAMLYVEQPGGVGYSSASSKWRGEDADVRTEKDVALDFYRFLQNFYRVFDDGNGDGGMREKKLFIAGESYAGMYIPSIARGIIKGNERLTAANEVTVGSEKKPSKRDEKSAVINLQGVAIGNGWIDAYIQGPTVIDYAFWHGMIDLRTFNSLHEKWDECIKNKITSSESEPFHPFTTPDECGVTMAVMEASGSSNMYDVTTYDTYPVHVDPHGTIAEFFNDADVRMALNAPSSDVLSTWEACVPGSGRRRRGRNLKEKMQQHNSTGIADDYSGTDATTRRDLILLANDRTSVVPYIAELLDEAKVRILFYNGDLDLSCSSQSTEMVLDSMKWSGNEAWLNPDTTQWKEWIVEDQVAGHTKRYSNLEFVVVYNSGHFVPVNQARNSLNLIGRMLDDVSFGDESLPQFPSSRGRAKEPLVSPVMTIPGEDENETYHAVSITTALWGCILGALISSLVTSHILLKKRKRASQHSQSGLTEITPLKARQSKTID